jgi:hypothetical protein
LVGRGGVNLFYPETPITCGECAPAPRKVSHMNDQTLLFTLMFAAVLVLVAIILYRLLRVAGRTREEGKVDLAVRRSPSPRYQLSSGAVYLLGSRDVSEGVAVFKGRLSRGDTGLLVSRTFPDLAVRKYRLGDTRCVWLSRDEKKGGVNPTALGPLLEEIEEFVEASPKPVVLVSDIDYLLEENDFKRFFRFVKGLREVAESGTGRIVIAGTLKGLEGDEKTRLLREVRELGGGRNRPRRKMRAR